MNKEETLALYTQGKEAWNAWAKDMLDKRDGSPEWRGTAGVDFVSHAFLDADFSGFIFPGSALFGWATFEGAARFEKARFTGDAQFEEATFKGISQFENATFMGAAVFREARFTGDALFRGATFKGAAEFQGMTFEEDEVEADFMRVTFESEAAFFQVTFKGPTLFEGATFKGAAEFWEAKFTGYTLFRGATFRAAAMFENVTFKGAARNTAGFERTTFEGAAVFGLSTFEHSTSFYGAKFRADADFKAVQGSSAFTMADAEFMEIPDFQQATFVQAPRLDNVRIGPQPSRWDKLKAFFTKGDSEKEGRWRTLKRLATQGHDHASEQLFFRGELLARRGVTDRYWHASFWLGLFYQIFSDFGRSLSRPFIVWLMALLGFAGAYAYGNDGPWQAAFLLSLHKSLPAVSSFSGGLPGLYARLYGVASCDPFLPVVPDSVIVLGIIQTLFSVVLIFLFLLAVRNHFRIK